MPVILLIDDSPVERRLAGGLFEKELDWLVEYAASGEEALERMELTLPDLVVTDLMMPGIDGLQLVALIRERYAQVPVILMTAHGSQSLAVEALECGAASYVPKEQLAANLLDTARQVLALQHAEQTPTMLVECLVETKSKYRLVNDPCVIPSFVEEVQAKVESMKLADASDVRHLSVAIEEALLNAMLHGNLALSPGEARKVRSDLMRGMKSKLVADRRKLDPQRTRTVHVTYEISRRQVQLVVRDEGAGFDTRKLPTSGDPSSLDANSGRGLVLIENFMDEVRFNDAGNELTMVKRWP